MRRERPRELLTDPPRSHVFEFLVAGAVLISLVLMFTLDLGMDLQEGFERFGGGAGDERGPQSRGWGVAEPAFSEARDLPATGVLARRRAVDPDAARVTLLPRKGSPHAYVKLVDAASGALELSAFVRATDTLEVGLGPGEYELRYAFGDTWFGATEVFGAATRYGAAKASLDLRGLDPSVQVAASRVLEFPGFVDGAVDERPLTRRDF